MINGWWGVLFLSKWNTAIHGVVMLINIFRILNSNSLDVKLTASIIGVFALYSVLEVLLKEDLGQV